jgi:hypothetical protein
LEYAESRDDFAGLNFFPFPDDVDQCNDSLHNPLQVDLESLAHDPLTVRQAIETTVPGGGTPTIPALTGSLIFAINHQIANPDRSVIVILITDGLPSECGTDVSALADLAAVAFEDFGVRTYVVGLGSVTDAPELHQIAESGGIESTFPVIAISSLADLLVEVRKRSDPFDFRNGFESQPEIP